MNDQPWVTPDPDDARLTATYRGLDEAGSLVELPVVVERPMQLLLNDRPIVTLMTIGAHLDWLALGYLLNHDLLAWDNEVSDVQIDEEAGAIRVWSAREPDDGPRDAARPAETGGAAGTMFGDLLADPRGANLDPDARIDPAWIPALQNAINGLPSLYQKSGALHACVLCHADRPLVYVEEIGRHGAIDMIAGYLFLNKVPANDKILYSTGRLTHGMVIKAVKMGIPILLTRSGFSSWGIELARAAGLTMIGRIRGGRYIVVAGETRVAR